MKYRKKPVVVEAIQVVFGKTKTEEVIAFVGENNLRDGSTKEPKIVTLEGVMLISDGDYVIKGVAGEFYPCKPDIFEATYEKVEFVKPSEIKVTVSVDNIDEIIARFAEKVEEYLNQVAE